MDGDRSAPTGQERTDVSALEAVGDGTVIGFGRDSPSAWR